MSGPAARVLFVCTANRARSPMAEVIARDLFVRTRLDVEASSAGFLVSGWPAEPEAQRVAHKRGLDLSEHVSRELDDDIVAGSDLILTMTGDHVLKIASAWPDATPRTFTLVEIVTLSDVGPDDMSAESVRAWATEMSAGPRSAMLSGTLDIADPMGNGMRSFRRTAEEIDRHLGPLVERLSGSAHH